MPVLPRVRAFDSSLHLLSEGYLFVSNRCRELDTDVFQTRLMLERVVCMQGAEAARIFYGGGRFSRRDAVPKVTLRLLQDIGSVQQLDGAAHRHRKSMFMSMMKPDAIDALAEAMERHWMQQAPEWELRERVVLLDEVQAILCRAVCEWVGVPLAEADVAARTRELAAMIEAAGSLGPRGWHALLLRRRSERWVREMIEAVRNKRLQPREGSPVHIVAWHREPDGSLLPTEVAAVELLNLLRPTVAVSLFVVFSAMALRSHPIWLHRLRVERDRWSEPFVQEVRRFYPFFPLVGGRVRQPFEWRGHAFVEGAWVVLDLYGTNHDPRIWGDPELFRPERFQHWVEDPYELIPQGGGAFDTGHRCPGEWATIALMKRALDLLTSKIEYQVPEQDLSLDLAQMPALPPSRFVISNVARTA